MPSKIKGKNGKEYYFCTINHFKEYRKKLEYICQNNPNLEFLGCMEAPSKRYGFKVFGKDSFGISDIDLFYTLGEINFFYYKLLGSLQK